MEFGAFDPRLALTARVGTIAERHGGRRNQEETMSSCSPPAIELNRPSVRLSIHDYSVVEAEKYKWIESEKAGRDLGEWAIRCWVREHWNGYLRARWLEHLEGRTFWIELDHDDYGLLRKRYQDSALMGEIVVRLKAGWENLDIICWAFDYNLPRTSVLEILEDLDINSRRIECQLEDRLCLSQAS
jgi:hypothetical protein